AAASPPQGEAAPPPRQRGRRRGAAAATAIEPEAAAHSDEGPAAPGEPLPDDEFRVAPATPEELAAIARAGRTVDLDAPVWPEDEDELVTWSPEAELASPEFAEADVPTDAELEGAAEAEGGASGPARRRRRRGGRGRRGRGGQGQSVDGAGSEAESAVSVAAAPAVAPEAAAAPAVLAPPQRPAARTRQPSLPAYPVEFEPLPPPTKRKPARRPGDVAEPRFSRAEIAEFEQFVRSTPGEAAEPAEALPAAPLTPEEQAALQAAAARPAPRRRGGRDRALPQPTPVQPSGLQETPAFAPLPAAPDLGAGASSLELLLARQNLLLNTLMERQVALLRNIERSLIAVDRRLATGGTSGAKRERAGVFVDVPNVIYAAERLGCQIDFSKLIDFLVHDRGRELVRASAYAPVSDDPSARLELQKFVQPFVNRGYRIVTKPLKRFADGTMKGNFDVELAMDVLTMADRLDVVCLVSGDGDFRRLVEMVASKGVRVEAIAFSQSTSSELKAACDEYIDLGLHMREICAKAGS
ncbi:MAG TPA: NYN domain-containing protein, partial [Dehalococcoidia bacterium]|nr:NYN domain-containing protein [Dehalococcoidia bacterium]